MTDSYECMGSSDLYHHPDKEYSEKFVDVILDGIRSWEDMTAEKDKLKSIVEDIHRRFGGKINNGGSRIVIVTDDAVYKIPVAERGLQASLKEASWNERDKGFPMARAEIIEYVDKLPILKMEKVTPIEYDELEMQGKLPDWEQHTTDGFQVGYLKCGKLVAYDA